MDSDTVLSRVPEGSRIYNGRHWSTWGADLAIVDSDSSWFDPATMTRRYVVRFAINMYDRTRYNAPRDTDIGLPVNVNDGRVPYEQAVWTIGTSGYGAIRGTFTTPASFRVKVALRDLDKGETIAVKAWLREQGYAQIDTKKSAKAIAALLARSFSELQRDVPDIANEADRILTCAGFDTCLSDVECDQAWRALAARGVWRDGRTAITWILPKASEA